MQLTQQPNVVITGVSTGIGFDAARYLIERGYRVFGSVRTHVDSVRVKAALGSAFIPLIFDVTDTASVATAVEQVQEVTGEQGLCALVNNSGISGTGPLINVPMDEVRQMFEVNVFGLLSVTQAFLPLLGARSDCPHPPGRIVNISSISGGLVFPLVGCYGATKHAVEAFTDGLRRELGVYKIKVIGIEPGNISTPMWDKNTEPDTRSTGTPYAPVMAALRAGLKETGRKGAPVELVSRAIYRAITARQPKTRYPLTPLWRVSRIFGDRILDRLAKSAIGMK